jgi:D-aminoacyl-tRNA deacylase
LQAGAGCVSGAAPPEEGELLHERLCEGLRELVVPVQQRVFGAAMQVELVNDGPVTIVVDL